MEFYWEIIEFDGTQTLIPPHKVELVKRRWGDSQPIHVKLRSIPANQIKKFQITDQPYGQQPLLEAASQAFREPLLIGNDAIAARWVKRTVTTERWNRYYSQIPAYRYLGEFNGMALMAFRLATHDINTATVSYCSEDEVRQLTRS